MRFLLLLLARPSRTNDRISNRSNPLGRNPFQVAEGMHAVGFPMRFTQQKFHGVSTCRVASMNDDWTCRRQRSQDLGHFSPRSGVDELAVLRFSQRQIVIQGNKQCIAKIASEVGHHRSCVVEENVFKLMESVAQTICHDRLAAFVVFENHDFHHTSFPIIPAQRASSRPAEKIVPLQVPLPDPGCEAGPRPCVVHLRHRTETCQTDWSGRRPCRRES